MMNRIAIALLLATLGLVQPAFAADKDAKMAAKPAAAVPADEPPVMRVGSQGLRAWPST